MNIPSPARQSSLALRNRRQHVRAGRTADGIVIRSVGPTLFYVSNKYAATFASGHRAVGRAVRFVRAAH